MKVSPLKLGFLASGNGSNMQAIVDACRNGVIYAEPAVVISNNSKAFVLERARQSEIDAVHLSSATHPDPEVLDKTICSELTSRGVRLVILAGYMKKLGPHTLDAFRNRILNVHPALLPAFGGQGMYGARVHEAVLASGATETGVTIHLVDDEYDQGPIVAQRRVPVLPGDTVESLTERIHAEEHELYVETIAAIARGEIVLASKQSSR